MRSIATIVLLASAACVTPSTGPHVTQRQALAQINPADRDRAFTLALQAVQRHGWMLAVSDRAAGLLTTQTMDSGQRTCGHIQCPSRTAVQITIADTGNVAVNLRREFYIGQSTGIGWFVPTYEPDVRAIEAEQASVLSEITGAIATASSLSR